MDISSSLNDPIITFSIILVVALLIPEFLKDYKITNVPFYIITGIFLGPLGIGLHLGEGLIFLGDVGLLFLIFLAGVEVYEMKGMDIRSIIPFVIIAASITFTGGFLLGLTMSFPIQTALLIGIVLISTSISEIVPMVNSTPSVKRKLSHIIFPSVVILDAASLILLGIIIKTDQPFLRMVIFLVELIVLLIISFTLLPRILNFFFHRKSRKPREGDLKFTITILMIIVASGYLIGVHGIVTSFIAGVIIGRQNPNKKVFEKIHGIGHAMLIPLFFIVLGMQLEIDVLFGGTINLLFPVLLLITLVTTKIAGGLVYSFFKKMPLRDGLILGIVIWPQLSATIAATAVGFESGIFDQEVLVSIVIMALVSALGTPFILRKFTKRDEGESGAKDHTIICGYGRTTSKVTNILKESDQPLVIIEKDRHTGFCK